MLVGVALAAQGVEEDDVAVRDLGEAPVGGGEQPEHLGQRRHRHVRPAEAGPHGDAEQPRGGQLLDLDGGQPPFGVPDAGAGREPDRERARDLDSLGVRTQHRDPAVDDGRGGCGGERAVGHGGAPEVEGRVMADATSLRPPSPRGRGVSGRGRTPGRGG